MPQDRRHLGQQAEQCVADHLLRAGCTILARNWRSSTTGELDLVVEQAGTLVFVEVRARRGSAQAAIDAALQSITPTKRARLLTLAQAYCAAHDLEHVPWRVDVIAVAFDRGICHLEIIRDALEW